MHIPQICIINDIFISNYETLAYSSEIFVMCISEFYLRANVTKYIDTKMSLFSCFLHTCEVGTKNFIVILTCTIF